MSAMVNETEAAARASAVQLRRIAVQDPGDVDQAFARIAEYGAEAVLIFPSPMLFNVRRRIVELATKRRLPSMANSREFPELGGLLSYGANLIDLNRRAATYVDKILKGTKPSELPVEQPTKFELVINLKTAKAFGLAVPEALLVRADEAIE
jgi:putative ABC transport system substrate-binding protein